MKTYVIRGDDDQDYELKAHHYRVVDGALLFEDDDDNLVMAYGPYFWSFVSVVEGV